MSVVTEPSEARSAATSVGELSGRDRLPRNVLWSWLGHGVFIIFGFIVPRLIDQTLGREALGVWDFGWALVSYFALVQAGVVSSVNRYVSRYRATGDQQGINRAVSSVAVVLALMAGVIVVLTAGATALVPRLMAGQLGSYATQAGWVVCLLGLSMAVQVGGAAYGGVLTGHHRWDLHNGIRAGAQALAAGSMVAILLLGGGLVALAAAVLAGEFLGRVAACCCAHRVCPELSVRPSAARWYQARQMLLFGGKGFLAYAGELLLGSTVGILIVSQLGPAALALYSRPLSLVRHARTLVQKFALVLTPTASTLEALGRPAEVRRLLIDATRYGAYLAVPMAVLLAILGGSLLRVWMGPDYERPGIIAILTVGYLALMLQRPALSVLSGLNRHGRPGLANFIAALTAIGGVAVTLRVFHGDLEHVALAIVVPLALANGVYVPLYACRCVDLRPGAYLRRALRGPLLCSVPFALCLIIALLLCSDNPPAALALGGLSGGSVLAVLYWRYALGNVLKQRLVVAMRLRRTRLADSSA